MLEIQGKPAELVEARKLRAGDVIARPNKPSPEPARLGKVDTDGDAVTVTLQGQTKTYTFPAGQKILRRLPDRKK